MLAEELNSFSSSLKRSRFHSASVEHGLERVHTALDPDQMDAHSACVQEFSGNDSSGTMNDMLQRIRVPTVFIWVFCYHRTGSSITPLPG